MFIRRMYTLHTRGEDALETYRKQQQRLTDTSIALLLDVARLVVGKEDSGDRLARIVALFGSDPQVILDQCVEHPAYTGNNYYPFLLPLYRSQRAVFFHFLKSVT